LRPASEAVDDTTIERWTRGIVRGDVSLVRDHFASLGASGPEMIWQPRSEDVHQPQLRFLLEYWCDLAGTQPMPRMDEVDAVAMRPALGFIVLLDVIEGGRDFRYRLYGSALADASGFDMTGSYISEHRASSHVWGFYLATYRAVLIRREPVFTEHGPARAINTKAWQRVVLPLCDPAGAIARFLVGNVPLTRDGKPYISRF
jgi:hypothetical protein